MSKVFSARRFRAMFVKEFVQIVRDPSTVLIAFVLPIALILVFGYAMNFDTARTPIGMSLQDGSEAATSLAGAYQSSRWFEVVKTGDVATLEHDLLDGHIRGIIVIPQDFGREVARGRGAIQAITDGTMPNNANFIASYAEGVRASWAAQRAADRGRGLSPPLSVNARFWFNPGTNSRFNLVPGAIAVVMTIIGTLLTALVIAREWERGTMEAVMATPLGMIEFVATKVFPYYLLGLGAMIVCTIVSIQLFGVPLRGSVFALFVITTVFLYTGLGQGLMISALTKNQFVASQIALLTAFLPSLLLSGFIYEIESTPAWVQWVTTIVPARYLIPPLSSVFLSGDNWTLFLPDLGMLFIFGSFFFLMTIRATKRRIA